MISATFHSRPSTKTIAWSLLAFGSWIVPSHALAADAPKQGAADQAPSPSAIQGTILSIDHGDVFVDLHRSQGIRPGMTLQLWRVVKIRHPVSHKWIRDRFAVGSLVISKVGEKFSLARLAGSSDYKPQPGDIVTAAVASQASSTDAATGPTTSRVPASPSSQHPAAGNASDPEAEMVSKLFESLKGASVRERIRAYEAFVKKHPRSKFAPTLREEAQALRRVLATASPAAAPPRVLSFRPPETVVRGTSLDLALELTPAATSAVLHIRASSRQSYRSFPFQRNGHGYWLLRLDGKLLQGRSVQYFIEASDAQGVAYPVVGAADKPLTITVLDPPRVDQHDGQTRSFAISTDYASYDRLSGRDYAWQTEGEFSLNFRHDEGIRAIRSGFGVYRGAGGSVTELDKKHLPPRSIGTSYGYVEGELGLNESVSLVGRLEAGLVDEGLTGGYAGGVRFGSLDGTNLLVGFDVLGGVGTRGVAQLQLGVFPRVPILVRTEVTDQPAGTSTNICPVHWDEGNKPSEACEASDIGGRGILQVGYRFADTLTVSGRLSYQGRTIHHAGPGFGAGISYQW